ncbi:MAG: ABC transporter substrate-binding protein [Tessaracoccus sp.]
MTKTPRLRRGVTVAAALLSATLAFTACGGTTEQAPSGAPSTASQTPTGDVTGAEETRTVQADNGTVEVPANPQRVAVLNLAAQYLDLGGEPIAVDGINETILADLSPEQQAAYNAATRVGDPGGDRDLEKLAGLEPDVIVMLEPESTWEEIGEKLTAIAPTVFIDMSSDSDAQLLALAEATNTVDALNAQIEQFEEKVAEIQEKHGEVLETAKVGEAYRWGSQAPWTVQPQWLAVQRSHARQGHRRLRAGRDQSDLRADRQPRGP